MSDLVSELLKLAEKKKPKGTATKRDPKKWAAAKARAKAKMGGKWSARAAQLAVKYYKDSGGKYEGKKPTAKNNKLKKWTKQDWQWSGERKKKSSVNEELVASLLDFSKEAGKKKGKGVYLPAKAIDALKSSKKGRKKLRSASRKKSKATREGKQHASHGLHKGKDRSKLANRAALGRELLEGVGHFLDDGVKLVRPSNSSSVGRLSSPLPRRPRSFVPTKRVGPPEAYTSNIAKSEVKRNAIDEAIEAGQSAGESAKSYLAPIAKTEGKRVGAVEAVSGIGQSAKDKGIQAITETRIPQQAVEALPGLPRTAQNVTETGRAKAQAMMADLQARFNPAATPSPVSNAEFATPGISDYAASLAGDVTQRGMSSVGTQSVARGAGDLVQSGIEGLYNIAPHGNLAFMAQREAMGALQRAGGYKLLGKIPGIGAGFRSADEAVNLVKRLEASGGAATNNEAFVRVLRETGDPNRAFMAHLEANPVLRQLQRDAIGQGGALSTPTNFALTATGLSGLRPGFMADTSLIAGSGSNRIATIQAMRNRLLQQGTQGTQEIMGGLGYLQAPTLKTTGLTANSASVGRVATPTGQLPDYLLNRASIDVLDRINARLTSAIGRRGASAGSGPALRPQELPGFLADSKLISDQAAGEATNLLSSGAANTSGDLFQGQASRGLLRRSGEANTVMGEGLDRALSEVRNRISRQQFNEEQARRFGQSAPYPPERPLRLIEETLTNARRGLFKNSSIKIAEELIKSILEEKPSDNALEAAYQLGKKLAALTTR